MFKIGDKVKILGGYVSGRYDWFREGTEGLIHEIQMHPTMGVVYMVPQSAYMYPEERLELVSPATQGLHRYHAGDAVIYRNQRANCWEHGIIIRAVAPHRLENLEAPVVYNIRTCEGERAGVTEDELMAEEYSLF